jgi:VWFA-related protein
MTAPRPGWISALSALLLAVLLAGGPSRPASAADALLVVNQVSVDRFPEVTVYFTAVDPSGLPITDIPKDRLQVIHNGGSVPDFALDLAESGQDGLAVVIAVDTSGSMKGRPLENAQAAARLFLDQMRPNDRAALVSFGQTVQVAQDLTGDRAALDRAIDGLTVGGDTAFYDAAFQSITLAASHTLGRRAVVMITDGEDTHSRLTLDDVVAKARETNTPVSVIGFGEVKQEPVQRLTTVTGGTLGVAPDSEHIAERAGQMASVLRKQYVLRYQAPDSRPPENELELVLNQDGRQARIAQRFPAPPMPALAVSLPDLAAGSTVRGTVELRPTIANASKVDQVQYRLDDTPLQTVAEPPYGFTWDTGAVPPGAHTLIVTARLGEQTAEQRVPLTVAPVSPTAPAAVATSAAGLPGLTGTASTAGTPSAVGTAPPGTTAATGATQSGTATSSTARTPTATATSASGSGSVAGFSAPVLIGIGTLIAAGVVGVIYASSGRRDEQQRVVDATAIPIGDDDRSSRSTAWPALPPAHPSDDVIIHPADRPTAGFGAAPTRDVREAETRVAPVVPTGHGLPSGALGRSTLAVSVAGGPPRSWPLALDQIIGRAAGPGVIVVTDPQVSRRHARISWEGGHFVYRDLGPMNPTRLDGRTLPNPYILKDGDRLRVGRAEIVFHA